MIEKMRRLSLLLFYTEKKRILRGLQELGVVDLDLAETETARIKRATQDVTELKKSIVQIERVRSVLPPGSELTHIQMPHECGAQLDLMRSLLMGLPIGSVVLNRRDHTNTPTGYVAVVDGKQRIETLRAVADGLLPIPAVWVDERFQGRTQVVDIDGEAISCVVVDRDDHPFLRVLGDFQLPAVEAKVKTIAEEAELFELINFGGVAQTDADRKRAAEIAGG